MSWELCDDWQDGSNVQDDTLRSSIKDALLELQSSPIPDCNSARNKELAKHILKHLEDSVYKSCSTLVDMAEFALTRSDLDLWIRVISLSVTKYDNHIFMKYRINVKGACLAFGFYNVRSSLDRMLHASYLVEVVDFIRNVPSYFSGCDDVACLDEWYKERITAAVNAMSYWVPGFLDIVSEIVQTYGIRCLFDIRCEITDGTTLDFARSLVAFLRERHDEPSPANLPASTHSLEAQSGEVKAGIDRIIYRLMTAISDYVVWSLQNWMTVGHVYAEPWGEYDEVITFVQYCLNMGQNEMCRDVLDAVFKAQGNEMSILHDLQIPIVRHLCLLLQKSKSPVYAPPFIHFFRQAIEQYSRLLGSRTHNPQLAWLFRLIEGRFHCSCDDCLKLSAFMKQVYVRQKTFLVSRKGYRHFRMQIGAARELAWFQAMNSPHGFCIKVIKTTSAFGEQRWEARIKAFREFLALIGDEEVIAKVMEEKYANLKEIMERYSTSLH